MALRRQDFRSSVSRAREAAAIWQELGYRMEDGGVFSRMSWHMIFKWCIKWHIGIGIQVQYIYNNNSNNNNSNNDNNSNSNSNNTSNNDNDNNNNNYIYMYIKVV